MSKIEDKFRAIGVINVHDALMRFAPKRLAYAVTYQRHDGWGPSYDKAQVYSPFKKTDPESHFADYGNKTFGGNRKKSVPKAIEFVAELTKTKLDAWVICPFDRSAWIHTSVREALLKALKKAAKATAANDVVRRNSNSR